MAQSSVAAARITTDVDGSSLTTLKGNVPRLARAEYDQGEASPSTQLTHVRLVLSRSAERQAALEKYLTELQDKSSPNYHKWLTPAEFGALYGPADSDVAALVAWLESHGLTLETVSIGRTNIAFSGTVSQVEEAFHTSIHSFTANGQQFNSNTTDPQIPTALAAVVKGVAHLNTIRPKPQFLRGSAGKINPQTKRLEPVNAVSAKGPKANLTFGSGTSSDPYMLYIVPGDAATIYDTPNTTFNANYPSGTSYTGAGVHIGIGGNATIIDSIVGAYRSAFLGSSTTPTLNYCTSSSSCSTTPGTGYVAGDADEAYLDTELSGGLAPEATIYYYASTDLGTGIEAAIDANVVDIFSLSFSECEQDMSTSDNAQINGWWEQAATQGIAVTVSSGDNGSAACDNHSTQTVATGGLMVNSLASTPYNIAVGGTDFYPLIDSFSTYVSTSLGSASTYFRTALNYIPESTWNNSTYYDTTISANEPWSAVGYASDDNIVAGSGGASNCSTNTTVDTSSTVGTCTSGYSKPSWQTGAGVPPDGVRDLPDVSLMSGNGYDAAVWLVCTDDTGEGVNGRTDIVTYNCETQPDGYSYFTAFGGTSTAAPAFAGILALVEQKTGSRLGQAAKELYALYNGSHSSAVFHDTTVGNNSVPCTSGTPNCVEDTAGYFFESGYNTTTGYDLATGLGSVDVKQLLTYWGTATGSATATVSVTPSPNPVISTQSLSVLVSVTGSSGTPIGTVTLSGGGYTSSMETLSNGSYTFNIAAGSLSAGTDTLTVIYNGDEADTPYAMAIGTATVTVTGPTFALTATTPAAIASPGRSTTSTVTVSTTTGYTGTVTLSCVLTASPSGATYLPHCSIPSTAVAMGGTATATVTTTAATTAALVYPNARGKGRGWMGAGGGAVLAFLVFLGIPARRRSWRSMLGILVLMAALGSLAACGGGGGSGGGGGGGGISGTTLGTYTFTVRGTGIPSVSPVPTTTFTVTVN
jgi:subtilase family serine protease